jgi:hypothetical protein
VSADTEHKAPSDVLEPVTPSASWFTAGRGLVAARFVIAVGVSAVMCVELARHHTPGLPTTTDIVGYPTYWNYNFEVLFWTYRLVVYAFPLFAILGYALLSRFGPLRSGTPRPSARVIELVEPAPVAVDATGLDAAPMRPNWGTIPRILLPTAVVVSAAASRTAHADPAALSAGVAYLVVIGIVAEWWARRTDGQRWRALSAVNGVGGAVAAVLGLWYVSAHTVVQSDAGTRTWPWLVWWLPVLGVAAIMLWSVRQLRAGRAARDVELTLLCVVVGATAVFLATSALPGRITYFQGFDDSLEMAGATVVAHGYFPWRDVLFTHGLFPDVLTGSLGRAIFDDSIWGVFAFHSVILVPLCWVSVYLFAVWVSRRNPWFCALFFLGATSDLLPLQVSERFIGVPVSLIVLAETLRRRSVAWAAGLTLLLVAQEILVPETIFMSGPALAVIVLADLVHRRSDRSLWANLRLTRWCVATGLIATAAWAGFLAVFGSLRAFIDYYIVFGPGHNLEGALPSGGLAFVEKAMFATGVAAVLLSIWMVAVKVARRSDWEPRDWVAVAGGLFMALYLEKALGRLDYGHVWQVFGAGLSIVLLWSWRLLADADRLIVSWWHSWQQRRRTSSLRFARPVTAALVPVVALGLVAAGPPTSMLRGVDSQHQTTGATVASFPRLGYASPTAIDTTMLRDLDTAIRAYAGNDAPVFDMTNSLGYVYYLLGREPGTQFIHVSMAQTEYSQQLLIDELKAVRPPVVIYDATKMGMPVWDGITNNIRHYDVSEFVLNGWTPVLRTHDVLVMARNDLVSSTPVPSLTAQPDTTDLYFTGPTCSWGTTPDFLPVADSARATTLAVRSSAQRLLVNFTGWAVDPASNRPATTVLIADGDRVVGTTTPSIDRPDVASLLKVPTSASGFQYDAVLDAGLHPAAYAVGADGVAHPLGGAAPGGATVLRMPSGSTVTVASAAAGHLETHTADTYRVGEIQVPSGVTLRDYDLARLSAAGSLGGASVTLTDHLQSLYHGIKATWLNKAGSDLTLRVGSCPQWYGYDASKPIYVVQDGGPPVTSVTLSARQG